MVLFFAVYMLFGSRGRALHAILNAQGTSMREILNADNSRFVNTIVIFICWRHANIEMKGSTEIEVLSRKYIHLMGECLQARRTGKEKGENF